MFSFIDLFAGIGGLRKGFESAGGRCVFTSEWDKYCLLTYKANHICDHEVTKDDITKLPEKSIPGHDVLLAGFPCQPFSIAGVSKKNALGRPHGFSCDTQGSLFRDLVRIIKHHRPKAFLLENVKNLLSHDGGRTFKVISEALENELKYRIHPRVINAKGFVPQHRERIFIVGFKEENGFNIDNLKIPDPDSGPKLGSILHPEDGSEEPEAPFTSGKKGKVNKKYTLTDPLWSYLQKYADKHRAKGNGFGYSQVGHKDVARTLSARYYKDGSEILVKQHGNKNPRRLTPRECARLMGFEKPGQANFKIEVSDVQAYKQFGNAAVVPVVEAVARHMKPYILSKETGLKGSMEDRAVD